MKRQQLFNSVEAKRAKTNVFDLSHDVKLSCNMGELIPTTCIECIPGDRFHVGCESLVRFAPIVSPVMHRFNVTMHYFFTPHRILWENWDKFITQTKVVGVVPAFPTWTIDTADPLTYGRLHDYLGIPPASENPGATGTENISAIPQAVYQCIYNEYYRDQNLQAEVNYKLVDGDNSGNADLLPLRLRAWEHDYFTSALPFAQKGDAVELPLGTFGNVPVVFDSDTGSSVEWDTLKFPGATPFPVNADVEDLDEPGTPGRPWAMTSLLQAGASLISDVRRAFKLQEFMERMALGGTRLKEFIWSMFGVQSPDQRLQRPEYITGTISPVVISEVLNTTGTDDAPQGNMAGHGFSVTQGGYGGYFVREHGYIMAIMSITPKTAYSQGIPKHFLKTADATQHYFSQFALIGEQEVENREIYAYQGATTGSAPFGYVPRYAEYKFENNRVAGDFRTSLDFWHLSRKFATPPQLNSDFIECEPDTRIFAVEDPDVQKMYCHVLHKVKAVRGMPRFGTPQI